jgi:hypothetical protein
VRWCPEVRGQIQPVLLDVDACDLILDSRGRLHFGAGKRVIFLAALTIAVMDHAVGNGYPHLGFVVIDSPLKSYADPKRSVDHHVLLLCMACQVGKPWSAHPPGEAGEFAQEILTALQFRDT